MTGWSGECDSGSTCPTPVEVAKLDIPQPLWIELLRRMLPPSSR